jgi:hypothetical protein
VHTGGAAERPANTGRTLAKERLLDTRGQAQDGDARNVINARQTGNAEMRATAGYLSYGPPWAHYLGGYQDRLLGGPLGLPDLRSTVPDGVKHKDCRGEVL